METLEVAIMIKVKWILQLDLLNMRSNLSLTFLMLLTTWVTHSERSSSPTQLLTLNQIGNLDEAIQCYRSSLRLKPDHPHAYNNLGISLVTSSVTVFKEMR